MLHVTTVVADVHYVTNLMTERMNMKDIHVQDVEKDRSYLVGLQQKKSSANG